MAIFTGSKSTAINSPRHLVLRHARRVVARKGASARVEAFTHPEGPADDANLSPGQEQVNSFWAPGLEAGTAYTIDVQQTITDPSGIQLQLSASQKFNVDAPQYVLPKDSVYSVYPPSGYSDDHRILPHIVLTDPHLPWERFGDPAAGIHDTDRNRTPWLILLAFSQEELRLDHDFLAKDFPTSPQLPSPVTQTSTMAVNMNISDLMKMSAAGTIATPVSQPAVDTRADFVFVKQDMFTSFFSPFDDNNQRQVPTNPVTSPYQYLAHVRKINTTGMAVAGVEDVGIFSVVVSGRTGPLDNQLPATMSVHLLSIEGVTGLALPIKQSYVALCSLHSWNYTVNPPGMLNVEEAFVHLGSTLNVLRPSEDVFKSLLSGNQVQYRLGSRIQDGYTLLKYRTQTGEQSVAMSRGPLTPTIVSPLSHQQSSNSGVDFQILDQEIGIMDITYCLAWQLGRTMALGDQAFTSALTRLRTSIHTIAMNAIKLQLVKQKSASNFRTRIDVLSSITSLADKLSSLHTSGHRDDGGQNPPFIPGGPMKRWYHPRLIPQEIPGLSFQDPSVQDLYPGQAIAAAQQLALDTNGNIYDETEGSNPVSTDWMVVLAWIMDRKYLSGIPAHYMIIDPSHLPPESLRFFYIDPNWIDALIDGALSLSNHNGIDYDRLAIKTALKDFILHQSPHTGHLPQIPSYGFFLRSDLVTMYPDLKVSTLPASLPSGDLAPLLRHEILEDGVMMTLLDRQPAALTSSGNSDFTGLVFTQPPHQQRFAAGYDVEVTEIDVALTRQYTVDELTREKDPNLHNPLQPDIKMKIGDPDNIFVFGSTPQATDLHMLRLPQYANTQLTRLLSQMDKTYFDDDQATSALLALQLNDPYYSLTVNFSDASATAALAGLMNVADGATAKSPRTLRLLKPAKINKGTRSKIHPSTTPAIARADHLDLAKSAIFRRLQQPSASFLQPNLAPHIRVPPTLKSDVFDNFEQKLAERKQTLGALPANFPKFTCQVTSTDLNYVRYDSLRQDLIFQVHVSNNTATQYNLMEFDIQLMLTGPGQQLLAVYDGTGVSMLSNLRFNAVITYSPDQSYMILNLLPRSVNGYVNVGRISAQGADGSQDLSFVLALASVMEYQQNQVQVVMKTIAKYYVPDAAPVLVQDSFLVNIINPNVSA